MWKYNEKDAREVLNRYWKKKKEYKETKTDKEIMDEAIEEYIEEKEAKERKRKRINKILENMIPVLGLAVALGMQYYQYSQKYPDPWSRMINDDIRILKEVYYYARGEIENYPKVIKHNLSHSVDRAILDEAYMKIKRDPYDINEIIEQYANTLSDDGNSYARAKEEIRQYIIERILEEKREGNFVDPQLERYVEENSP